MRPMRGIALKMLSIVVFFAMATLVKLTAPLIPPGEAVFFRSAFSLPVIVVWLAWRGEMPRALSTTIPMGHVWRGLIGTTSMALSFWALGLLSLPEATVIGYAAPILTVIFAAMFLGEEVRAFRITAVALGMAGVVIVMAPRLTLGPGDLTPRETLGAVVALGAAVFAALAQVQVRRLVLTEHVGAIVFWFLSTAAVLSLLTLPWGWVVPGPGTFALLVLTGILGGIGQILLTACYRHADAGVVAPFDYTSIILALSIGYLVFDEVPTLTMLAGAAIIIASGVVIIWRERRLGLRRSGRDSGLGGWGPGGADP
ncbi:MAG: DMT family transporter [Rubellimicrobium sp.]|nr:DMT family transporter [Rubellimicrobium sp.]